ncbi:glycosyltransferase [Marinobacter sp. LV10MA510-1]|uniref:glycosyltransferase n=1 Tax=Marinobacter sp. LV10MA510-1 TaxID=1415567 RepID=UPI0015CF5F81|nr:glycosyltransferase [Marinobacter sp. LV10MA510-1]
MAVFFKASHGGLHENILATARFLIANGHQATIVCPAGPFSDSLVGHGIGVIRTDFSDQASTLEAVLKIHSAQPFDLVYAHPFAARTFGQAVADRLYIPFILTLHGKYTDDLARYIDKVAAVLTVSPGIRDFLQGENVGVPEKFHVVPNVPDTELFKPLGVKPRIDDGRLQVALVSRLDKDKAFILDVFADAVEYAGTHYVGKVAWVVVGDGTHSDEFRTRLGALRGDNTLEFSGWLEGEALRDAY